MTILQWMILQCFFLPAEHLVVSFLLEMSNQTRWKTIAEAANSFKCMLFNCQLPLMPCVTFLRLFVLRIHSTASRQASAADWRNACDLYRMPCLQCFHSALFFLFLLSSFCISCFHILRHLQLVKRPTASIKHSWPQQHHGGKFEDPISSCVMMNPFQVINISYFLNHLEGELTWALVARAYFWKGVKCPHPNNMGWCMGMIHSQVMRYLRG